MNEPEARNLLEITLAAARDDEQTVEPTGEPVATLPDGVSFRPVPRHVDERGSVLELFDPRWNWHPDPLVFCYAFTIRPGIVKGWNLHRHHEDRYFLLQGELEVVLYDVRPEASSYGQVSRIQLSEHRHGLVNVPAHVWHADHNIGQRDALVVNFPTTPYDHAAPDKARLPLDTPLIPHDFGDVRGW